MKIKLPFIYFLQILIISFFSVSTNTAQSNSEIILELYDGAYGLVDQADDLISMSVQAVWTASGLTGAATFTGTLTQNATNPDIWTYSASPTDKLVLHFATGSEIFFTFTVFEGYTEGTADDFLDLHTLDFNSELTGVFNVRIQSQVGPNNGITEYGKIITGNSVYGDTPVTINLTNSGDRSVSIDYGFAFGDYHNQTSGTVSTSSVNFNISESYSTYIGHNSNNGTFTQERFIHNNNQASGSFGTFSFQNLYCHYEGGTHFIDSANVGHYNFAESPYNWEASGQLLKDNQVFANVQFNAPPENDVSGSLLIAKGINGNDYLLDNLLMWWYVITDVKNESVMPSGYYLSQNYPNPFNPTTVIKYSIPPSETGHTLSVQLRIYDVLGREIIMLVNKKQNSGLYKVNFDASQLPSGVYIYRISVTGGTENYYQTKKMILLK